MSNLAAPAGGAWPFGPLRPGLIAQPWLGALDRARGLSLEQLAGELAALGFWGVAWHVGPRTLAANIHRYAAVGRAAGLEVLGAAGLDGTVDDAAHHHDALLPDEKAEAMAAVASEPGVLATVHDAETREEVHPDEADVYCRGFARRAPAGCYTIHQPWGWPTGHPRFPYRTYARYLRCVAPQPYWPAYAPDYGSGCFDHGFPLYEREWLELERTTLAGVVQPRFCTITGVGNEACPWGLVRYLTTHRHVPTLVWLEPRPRPLLVACIRIDQALAARGFDGETAVLDFQRDYNRTAGYQVDEDNKAGHQVATALGIDWPAAA